MTDGESAATHRGHDPDAYRDTNEWSDTELAVMSALSRNGECSLGEVAEEANITRIAAQNVLSSLAQEDAVGRRPKPGDARKRVYWLAETTEVDA